MLTMVRVGAYGVETLDKCETIANDAKGLKYLRFEFLILHEIFQFTHDVAKTPRGLIEELWKFTRWNGLTDGRDTYLEYILDLGINI